jgi:hypothetical protein
MHGYALAGIYAAVIHALFSADPDDISAQIDLIGVLGPMIGGKPSAVPNGGSVRSGDVEAGSLTVTDSQEARTPDSPPTRCSPAASTPPSCRTSTTPAATARASGPAGWRRVSQLPGRRWPAGRLPVLAAPVVRVHLAARCHRVAGLTRPPLRGRRARSCARSCRRAPA